MTAIALDIVQPIEIDLQVTLAPSIYAHAVNADVTLVNIDGYAYIEEDAVGTIDGSNATFNSTHPFIPETLSVYSSGIKLHLIDDYHTIGTTTVVLHYSPEIGEVISVNYFKI